MSWRDAVAVILIAMTGATGCGAPSDPNASFRRELFETRDRFDPVGELLVATLQNAHELDRAQIAARFAGYADQYAEAADAFAALSPPEDIAPELMTFVDGLRTVSHDLNQIAQLAPEGSESATQAAQDKLVRDLRAANLAGRQLRDDVVAAGD